MPKTRRELFAMFQAQTGKSQVFARMPNLNIQQVTGYQPPRVREYKWGF